MIPSPDSIAMDLATLEADATLWGCSFAARRYKEARAVLQYERDPKELETAAMAKALENSNNLRALHGMPLLKTWPCRSI